MTKVTDVLTMRRPDDWHLHVRDGAAMRAVVPHTAAQFGRALIMPNLRPPVTTVADALSYRERILAAVPAGAEFEPMMTLYLTDRTEPDEIDRAVASGAVLAAKLYPAGATTNSDAGVTRIDHIDAVLERMAARGLVLCVHGEVTDAAIDMFDREKVFIDTVLGPLAERHPALRIVFEHITTEDAVAFVRRARPGIAATVTAHHLLLNRNALLAGGLQPHHYCLPVLKRERHRAALLEAVGSGDARFFLGTDSAPHARGAKESACGCAGCYTAFGAIELYAEAFDGIGALDRLEGFASVHGARFYGLEPSQHTLTLRRAMCAVPEHFDYLPDDPLVPLRAGGQLNWQVVPDTVN